MDHQNSESRQKNEKVRDNQVALWEQHLASIIEKTNRNIKHLSRVTTSSNSINDNRVEVGESNPTFTSLNSNEVSMSPYPSSYQNNVPPPIPPLPPPPSSSSSYSNSMFNNDPMSTVADTQQPLFMQSKAIHHFSTEGVVTRPIPKHVEDNLIKRIGQSIRKSIERSINDKIHGSQARIDSIHDKIESLSEDFARVQRERDALSRSLSTHDRLSRRLKSEWESQRMTLNQMESMIIEEKQAAKEELDVLVQRHTNDMASRVTVTQLKRAVETLSSKTRSVVEKTSMSVQNECRSDVSSLRTELKVLKESCENLRQEVKDNQEKYNSMLSTFNEQHIRNIIGDALQSHLDTLEVKAASNVRNSIRDDMKVLEDTFETKCSQKLSEVFNIDAYSKDNSLVKNIAFIMKSILEEKEASYTDMFASSFLSQLGRNEDSRKKMLLALYGDEYSCKSFNSCSHCDQVERKLIDLYKRVESIESDKKDMNTIGINIRNCINDQLMELVPAHITKNIEPLLSNFDRTKELDDFTEDWQERFRKLSRETSHKYEQILLEVKNNSSAQNDLSSIVHSMDAKCKNTENDVKILLNAKVADCTGEYEKKLSELRSYVEETKLIKSRIEALESKEESMQQHLHEKIIYQAHKTFTSLKDFDELKSKFSNNLDCMSQSLRQCGENLNMYENKIERLDTCVVEWKKVETAMQCRLDSIDSKMTDMSETVFNTLQSINSLQLEIGKERGSNDAMQSKENNYDAEKRMILQNDDKLNKLERRLDSQLSKLQKDFISVEANILEINSRSNERMNYLSQSLESQILSCKSECSSLFKSISKNQLQSSHNTDECISIQKESYKLKDEFNAHSDKINEINKYVNETKKSMITIQIEMKLLKNSGESLRADIINLNTKQITDFNDIETKLSSIAKNIEKLKGALGSIAGINEKIKVSTETIKNVKHLQCLKDVQTACAFEEKKKQYKQKAQVNRNNGKDNETQFDVPIREVMFQQQHNYINDSINVIPNNARIEHKQTDEMQILVSSNYSVSDSISGKITSCDEQIICDSFAINNQALNEIESYCNCSEDTSINEHLSCIVQEESQASLHSSEYEVEIANMDDENNSYESDFDSEQE